MVLYNTSTCHLYFQLILLYTKLIRLSWHYSLQRAMSFQTYDLLIVVLIFILSTLLQKRGASSHHYPPEDVQTFQRDSVEWIPSYEKPNQRSSHRSSFVGYVFGTQSLPLREAVESVPRHTSSYR